MYPKSMTNTNVHAPWRYSGVRSGVAVLNPTLQQARGIGRFLNARGGWRFVRVRMVGRPRLSMAVLVAQFVCRSPGVPTSISGQRDQSLQETNIQGESPTARINKDKTTPEPQESFCPWVARATRRRKRAKVYWGTALMVSMWLKFQPAVPGKLYSATISGFTAIWM